MSEEGFFVARKARNPDPEIKFSLKLPYTCNVHPFKVSIISFSFPLMV
jgi:hypothetical protein